MRVSRVLRKACVRTNHTRSHKDTGRPRKQSRNRSLRETPKSKGYKQAWAHTERSRDSMTVRGLRRTREA